MKVLPRKYFVCASNYETFHGVKSELMQNSITYIRARMILWATKAFRNHGYSSEERFEENKLCRHYEAYYRYINYSIY